MSIAAAYEEAAGAVQSLGLRHGGRPFSLAVGRSGRFRSHGAIDRFDQFLYRQIDLGRHDMLARGDHFWRDEKLVVLIHDGATTEFCERFLRAPMAMPVGRLSDIQRHSTAAFTQLVAAASLFFAVLAAIRFADSRSFASFSMMASQFPRVVDQERNLVRAGPPASRGRG